MARREEGGARKNKRRSAVVAIFLAVSCSAIQIRHGRINLIPCAAGYSDVAFSQTVCPARSFSFPPTTTSELHRKIQNPPPNPPRRSDHPSDAKCCLRAIIRVFLRCASRRVSLLPSHLSTTVDCASRITTTNNKQQHGITCFESLG
jgi:hypothetical protein